MRRSLTPHLALVVTSFVLMASVASAGSYSLEIRLISKDEVRQFIYKCSISRNDSDDIARSGDRAIQRWLTDAKRSFAEKRGYRESLYGADFWKMVRVDDWVYAVFDDDSRRTLTKGGKGRIGGSEAGGF
ncbi:MAG: hypothetical protein HY815_15260 [Candidatus Riflebacteria bacterium]|nr:hypothetical protein [Candidatus Riflebacteria bacterium]